MAARMFLQRRTVTTAVSVLAASALLYPQRTLHAESPPPQDTSLSPRLPLRRKPIYSDLPPPSSTTTTTTKTTESNPPPSQPLLKTTLRPTPTSRLTTQIQHARLALQSQISNLETHLNSTLSTLLSHERALASTISSLSPPPQANEHLLPGSIYVLVSAMAGSILSRNRNILLRATAPLAAGLTVANFVLPATMDNLGKFVWEVEVERAPVLARNQERVRGAVEEGERVLRDRFGRVRAWGEDLVRGGREGVEGWVRGS